MPRFIENAKLPITSELIRQGFWPDEADTLTLLDRDDEAHGQDSTIAIASAAIAIISGAGSLALAGLTVAILPSIAGLGWAGIAAYNAKISQRDRQEEAEFLMEHPEILRAIDAKLEAGEERRVVAAAFEQCLKLWRYGDTSQFARFMGQPPAAQLPQTQIENPAPYIPPLPQDQDATTQQEPASLPQSGSQQAARPSRIEWNPAIDLGRNPQSALIVGTPGSGKGMLVSNAIRELRKSNPGLTVMLLDPKADTKERGYWEGVVDHLSSRSARTGDPDDTMEWVLSKIDEFLAMPSPKLLILDEMLQVSTVAKMASKELKATQRLKLAVCGIVAQGDSNDEWVWLMSQSPQVEDLGITGGVRGNLRAIGLISPKNTAAIDVMTSTRLIPPPIGGMDELRSIMEQSPVSRAVFDGKLSKWLPMPKLENHSGYDRDSRQEIGAPMKPAIKPLTREGLERLYRESPSTPTVSDADPTIELIESEPNPAKREALMIAYQWAQNRLSDGKEISRDSFLNRAKNERKCDYLRENRNEVWNELERLIS